MAYKTHIDSDLNCIFVQHLGTYVEGEDTEQLTALVQDPAFKMNMNLLRDVTQTSLPDTYDLKWFSDHAQKTMELTDNTLGTGRKAAWVLGNPHDFKVIHQWGISAELNFKVLERRPFLEMNSAFEWLKIPEGYEVPYPV